MVWSATHACEDVRRRIDENVSMMKILFIRVALQFLGRDPMTDVALRQWIKSRKRDHARRIWGINAFNVQDHSVTNAMLMWLVFM